MVLNTSILHQFLEYKCISHSKTELESRLKKEFFPTFCFAKCFHLPPGRWRPGRLSLYGLWCSWRSGRTPAPPSPPFPERQNMSFSKISNWNKTVQIIKRKGTQFTENISLRLVWLLYLLTVFQTLILKSAYTTSLAYFLYNWERG